MAIPHTLRLLAPLSGQVYTLEQIPDPVFAKKMVGDGLSIDPTNACLVAPCDGKIATLHPAGHAVTVLSPEGIEVLMHIGLDTVKLRGQGFTPKVKRGASVSAGDPLIEFDLDFLATHAKSLLTQIVITNSERIAVWNRSSGMVIAGESDFLTLELAGSADQNLKAGAGAGVSAMSSTSSSSGVTSDPIVIPNPTGLHARPSAVIANLAKNFKSSIKLQIGDRQANAKSLTSIMSLEAARGDRLQIIAEGSDAREAIARLSEVISAGCGDEGCAPAPAPATTEVSAQSAPAPRRKSADPNVITGVSASPGLAVGQVFQIRHQEIDVVEVGESVEKERRRLQDALDDAAGQLEALRAQLHAKADSAKAAIFAAHQELLEDPDLLEMVESGIAKGKSAAYAWKQAIRSHSQRLASLRNELLAQRANDLRDVGQRVLQLLTGIFPQSPQYPADAVLIAEDLAPSDTAAMDRTRVMGFCTIRGGATSHVAILARSLGIPALAGTEPGALDIPNGTSVILDGGKGTLRLNPSADEVRRIRRAQELTEVRRKENLAKAREPAITLDGTRIEVVANIGGLKDAMEIAGLGGEGVGLLRSEFLFMERSSAPTEDEQFESYRAIAQAVGPEHPLIIRTLDVGGDKPLAYMPIPREDNPFLGERGVRIGLDRPEILRTQLRAILRASTYGKIRVMFPMISLLTEVHDVKAMLR
ncbi:MAG: phosphoenolpyruvate--protein phosphotransferase, partial [Candidatus Methylacidiphilales bacterium]